MAIHPLENDNESKISSTHVPDLTSVYRVGALSWSILVLVRLGGSGVGALDARYGVMDGMEAENEEKYSAAN